MSTYMSGIVISQNMRKTHIPEYITKDFPHSAVKTSKRIHKNFS